MKVPLSLLKKWIPLEKSPDEVADVLTQAGLEVDAIDGELLEVSLTPNLSHCMSLFGVARELSALFNLPLKPYSVGPLTEGEEGVDRFVKAHVEESKLAPLYSLRVVDGVKVGPSPAWLVEELRLMGVKSINTVVDVTNYVMHLIGQPLHAFDGNKIPSRTLLVRRAKPQEKLELLDGRHLLLDEEMLVIADSEKPLALAGIMGGISSSVDEETSLVILEAAHFSPSVIRRASKKSGVSTESSKRFERGHDPNLCESALTYAAFLIQSLAGGTVAKGSFVSRAHDFPAKTLMLRLTRVNQVLGLTLSLNEVEELLKRLQFLIHYEQGETLQVKVPTWRIDINAEIDLVEEIARLYGFNNIPRKRTAFRLSSIPSSPLYLFLREMEQKALRLGLQQLLTSDLIGLKEIDRLPHDEKSLIRVNASVQEQSILRPSLLPGLLNCLKHNVDFKQSSLAGFEIGHVYYQGEKGFLEEEKMGIILHGDEPDHWSASSRPVDFFAIKGLIEGLLAPVSFVKSALPVLHPHQQLEIFVQSEPVGFLGQLSPLIAKSWGIETPIYFAEINLRTLSSIKRTPLRFNPLPHYPSTERDLTLSLKEETPFEELLKTLKECQSPLLEKVSLISVYRHESLGKDRKNLTLRFSFRSPEKTLSFEEAEQEFARLSHALESSYAIKNR